MGRQVAKGRKDRQGGREGGRETEDGERGSGEEWEITEVKLGSKERMQYAY